jgi:hypothetical protein
MEQEPKDASPIKIFKTVIFVLIIDLAITVFVFLIMGGKRQNLVLTSILLTIVLGQLFLFPVLSTICFMKGEDEIGAGLLLALPTFALLSFILCVV